MSENQKPRKTSRWALLLPILGLSGIVLFFFLVLRSEKNTGPAPLPEVDYPKAKAMSDGAADDLVRHDVKDLSNRLDLGFHTVIQGPADLDKELQKMYETYGRPQTCVFKTATVGKRVDGTWNRPTRSFYYAVKTTRYPMGRYFLKIEVVPSFSGGFLDVSGFGFFTFNNGKLPASLR